MVSRFKHYNFLQLIVRMLLAALMVFAILYIYFLCASIRNVVIREELEQDIASLSSSIGELESEYFALESTIDIETAQRLGMIELEDKAYAPRYSKRGSVTLND